MVCLPATAARLRTAAAAASSASARSLARRCVNNVQFRGFSRLSRNNTATATYHLPRRSFSSQQTPTPTPSNASPSSATNPASPDPSTSASASSSSSSSSSTPPKSSMSTFFNILHKTTIIGLIALTGYVFTGIVASWYEVRTRRLKWEAENPEKLAELIAEQKAKKEAEKRGEQWQK